jgi:hypothetical protein
MERNKQSIPKHSSLLGRENWGRKQPLVCILTFWNKGFGIKQPPIQSNPRPRKTLPPP